MTAVSLSVQPKIFSDRETAISCLVSSSLGVQDVHLGGDSTSVNPEHFVSKALFGEE